MSSDPLNNNERVLRALRAAGGTGIVASDFLGPTIDGGRPILRLAVAVHRLRQRGYVIDSTRRRRGGQAVYVLIGREEGSCSS